MSDGRPISRKSCAGWGRWAPGCPSMCPSRWPPASRGAGFHSGGPSTAGSTATSLRRAIGSRTSCKLPRTWRNSSLSFVAWTPTGHTAVGPPATGPTRPGDALGHRGRRRPDRPRRRHRGLGALCARSSVGGHRGVAALRPAAPQPAGGRRSSPRRHRFRGSRRGRSRRRCDRGLVRVPWRRAGPLRDLLAVDDETWDRARGYALTQAVQIIPYYAETNPAFVAMAVRTRRGGAGRRRGGVGRRGEGRRRYSGRV